MTHPKSPPTPVTKPGDPLDLSTSVAGEEDPGASFDTPPGSEGPPLPASRGNEAGQDKPAGGKA